MSSSTPTHSRQKIREALLKRLMDKTIAGDQVFSSYSLPTWAEQLPVVLIYAQSEQIEERSQAPRELRRNLFLSVECIADGDDNADMESRLDILSEQVEQLISSDDSLDCTVDDIILTSVEFQYEDGGETQTPIGSVRMAFNAKYRDFMPKNMVSCDEFKTGHIDWDLAQKGEIDGVIDAEDEISLNKD